MRLGESSHDECILIGYRCPLQLCLNDDQIGKLLLLNFRPNLRVLRIQAGIVLLDIE